MGRWPGRITGLIAALIAGVVLTGTIPAGADPTPIRPALTVRDVDGVLLARVPLPVDRRFTLRYRNSLYGTLAEERFVVGERGKVRLVELAADQLAVLEEYYVVDGLAVRAPPGSRRVWSALPADTVVFDELRIAATDLGRRTLLAGGRSVPLWRLVETDPTVVLAVEGAGT